MLRRALLPASLAIGLWFALHAGATAEVDVQERPSPSDKEAEQEGPAYELEILGIEDDDLEELLLKTSRLLELEDRSPASLNALERRVETDRERFTKALRSEGYYDSQIDVQIDEASKPIQITIEITLGVRYQLRSYDIQYSGPAEDTEGLPRDIAALGLEIGMPARSKAIVTAQERLLRSLAEIGRPLAKVTDQRAVVEHAATAMDVTVSLDPGPETYFGELSFEGLEDVDESYVRRIVDWQTGERFDRRKLDEVSDTLVATGLFDGVKLTRASSVDAESRMPVTVSVTEAKHRSIGVGLSFSTDEGFGGEAFWEHRNFFGAQEKLAFELEVAEIRQELSSTFRKPNYPALEHTLILEASVLAQQSDAFEEQSATTSVGLERPLFGSWTGRGDVSLEYSRIDDDEGDRQFLLLGLPLSIWRDSSDDLLNPTEGSRLTFSVAPYGSTIDETGVFVINEIQASAYYAPFDSDRVVLAGRARVGSIAGDDSENIPANKRFYAGGGGSIRGYEFQSVGPLDDENDPLGGRSVVEAGLEVRFRIGENFGIVPFIEGGNVYDDMLPRPFEDAQWAAGLGLRYFTPIGPVRLDVGLPLNKRDVDDDFEFYISLGQAF